MAEGKMELEELYSGPAAPITPAGKSNSVTTGKTEVDISNEVSKEKNSDSSSAKSKDSDDAEPKERKAVSYFTLYRFASTLDYIYIIIALIASIGTGVGTPMVAKLMGNIVQEMTSAGDNRGELIIDKVVLFTIVGAAIFVAAYLQMCFWTLSAENQIKRIREEYLHAILRQDIGWHDTGKQSESLTTRLNSDTQMIYDGMAEKVGLAISSLTTFITGFVIGFTAGWKLSLVLLSCVPLIGACAVMMAKFTVQSATKGQDSYSKAGSVAEQAFSSIRTVVSFGGQQRETNSYVKELDDAFQSGKKKAIVVGLGVGAFMLILFSTYALAFWYGAREVYAGKMTGGEVLEVFMGMIIGAFALGNVGPNVSAFASAQGAAYNIFKTIDRVPTIDSASDKGAKPEKVQGHIIVKDVDFAYPSRPDVPILKKMNVEIKAGQTVALVGHSGSGKSTIIGLVERFYDPISGTVTLDGIEIKDWNVTHLRNSIGIVSQEPVLFNATIKQNISYGVRKGHPAPTDEEIINACKLSNAHDFIMRLPDKYNTMVGEKGALLSGGQKQ
ncbi:Multidrug resistance protein 1, partial [Lunasporangiospora selenospora]